MNINNGYKWIGGNRKLILIGDILCDRVAEGIDIINILIKLKDQAEVYNGDIIFIAGNHEDMLISFLLEMPVIKQGLLKNNFDALIQSACIITGSDGKPEFHWQGKGLLEFILKWSSLGRNHKNVEDLKITIEKMILNHDFVPLMCLPAEVRLNMQNSISGKIILDTICNMKLVYKDGDTLIFHTEPTKNILVKLLENEDLESQIEAINNKYQGSLRSLIFEEGILPENNEFNELSLTFLDPENRYFINKILYEDEISGLLEKLKSRGVSNIVHGHTTIMSQNLGFTKTNHINLINVDFGVGRPGINFDNERISATVLPITNRNEIIVGKECNKIEVFNEKSLENLMRLTNWLETCVPECSLNDKIPRDIFYSLELHDDEKLKSVLNDDLQEYLFEIFNEKDESGNFIVPGNTKNIILFIINYFLNQKF